MYSTQQGVQKQPIGTTKTVPFQEFSKGLQTSKGDRYK